MCPSPGWGEHGWDAPAARSVVGGRCLAGRVTAHGEQGVFLTVDEAGVTHLHVCGDGAGVVRFHALLREEAAKLAALGDTTPLEARMVRALGVIADRQTELDLTADFHVAWWGGRRG